MKSVWNLKEIVLTDRMRQSIDSFFRARNRMEQEYASTGLMVEIKKYLIEKESKEDGRK